MKRMAGLVQPRESEIFAHTSLRGLAALSVVGYHACLSSDITAAAGGPVAAFFLSSFIFVDLFFMLSGFIMVETYGARLYATPGLTGVKYSHGEFYSEPTLLHVSRGVGGRHPLRWNCRPEITKLVIRPAQG
jgi:hypothetical protein